MGRHRRFVDDVRTQGNKKQQDDAEYFYIKSNGRIERILYGDLLYIEAMSNYVTLYTVQTKFTAYLTVKGILEKLPPDRFVQVHKSTIVNTDHIRSIDGNLLHIGDNKITVSANFQTEAMDRILKDRYIKR